MSQKMPLDGQKGFAVGRGLLAAAETLNYSMGDQRSDGGLHGGSSRQLGSMAPGMGVGNGQDRNTQQPRRGGAPGNHISNTMKLFASLGLSPTDLDALAQIPEENISVETLPQLIMQLKNRKGGEADRRMAGNPRDLSSFSPEGSYRSTRDEWEGMHGGGRPGASMGQSSAHGQQGGDFGYGSMQEDSGSRVYDYGYGGSGGGGGGSDSGGVRQFSELSQDHYGGGMGPMATDNVFMPRRIGSPSQGKVQDFLGVMPHMFPHVCSLCDFDVHSIPEWDQHINGLRHSDNRRQLLQMYPDWDPGMAQSRRSIMMETTNPSMGLLGDAPIPMGQQSGPMPSSWGGNTGMGQGNTQGPLKVRSRVVVAKYDKKPLSNKGLFALAQPFGVICEHLVLKNKAFLEMQTHREALAMVNHYQQKPASLYGKQIIFYLSKELVAIEKDATRAQQASRLNREAMGRPIREMKGRPSQVVFFSNLPREVEKKMELLTIAKRFGTVEKHLFLNDEAFVQLGTPEDAEMLVKYYTLNPLMIKGRTVRLNICTKYRTLNVNRSKQGQVQSQGYGEKNISSGTKATTSKSPKSTTAKVKEDKKDPKKKAGAEKSGAEKSGAEKAGAEKSGAEKAGAEKSGAEKSEAKKAGAKKAGEEKAGVEKPGAEKPGAEKPGAEKAGAEKPGAEKAGAEGSSDEVAGVMEGDEEKVPGDGDVKADTEEADAEEADTEEADAEEADTKEADAEQAAADGQDKETEVERVEEEAAESSSVAGTEGPSGAETGTAAPADGQAETTAPGETGDASEEPEARDEATTAEHAESSGMADEGLPDDEGSIEPDFPDNMDDFVTLDELPDEDMDSQSKDTNSSAAKKPREMKVVNVVGFKRGHTFRSELLALAKPFGTVELSLVLDLKPEAFLQLSSEAEAKAMVQFYNGNVTPMVCGKPVRLYHSQSYPTIQCDHRRVVYVGGLPNTKYSDTAVLKIAEPYGTIRRFFLNRIRSECFIEMERGEDAVKMGEACKINQPRFQNKRLTVYVSRKYKQLKYGHRPPGAEPEEKRPSKRERADTASPARAPVKEADEPPTKKQKEASATPTKKQNAGAEQPGGPTEDKDDAPTMDIDKVIKQEEVEVPTDTSTTAGGQLTADSGTPVPSVKMEMASLPLPPHDPSKPIGVEFVKMGYYCRICFLFYSNEETAKKQHCSSKEHYDKLQKHLEKVKGKKASS